MSSTREKNSFDYLKEVVEILDDGKGKGLPTTSAAFELTIAAMNPEPRKRLWSYLRKVRYAMKDEIFEDDEDYITFIRQKNIKL